MQPRHWLGSCPRSVFGTGSSPPAKWLAWRVVVESPKAVWPRGRRTELKFTVEPPRILGSLVVNTARALSDGQDGKISDGEQLEVEGREGQGEWVRW